MKTRILSAGAAGLCVALFSGCASITIDSDPPGATVYLNGQYLGTTPLTNTFWIGQDINSTAEIVAPGHERSECVIADRGPGMKQLQIASAPTGAEVFIDGRRIGSAPLFTGLFVPKTMKGVWKAPAHAAPAPHPALLASCDLRVIRVSDGSAVGQASASGADLAELSKALADKLVKDFTKQGQAISVGSLRDRTGTPASRVVTDELTDKLAGSLISTKWFDVKERVDLRAVLGEHDLDTAEVVRNPKIRAKLSGIDFIVIGGVTVEDRRPGSPNRP